VPLGCAAAGDEDHPENAARILRSVSGLHSVWLGATEAAAPKSAALRSEILS
jgi:hypothetical protein